MFHYKCPACGRVGLTETRNCPGCAFLLRDADITDAQKSLTGSCGPIVGWTLVGGGFSLMCLFLGIGLAGAGHGWLVPAQAAFASFVTGPGTGLAWALRRTKTGWWVALCLMLFEILVDAMLVRILFYDLEERRFQKVWEIAPGWVIAWPILYFAHQLIALVIVFFYKQFDVPRTN